MDTAAELSPFRIVLKLRESLFLYCKIFYKCRAFPQSEFYYPALLVLETNYTKANGLVHIYNTKQFWTQSAFNILKSLSLSFSDIRSRVSFILISRLNAGYSWSYP